MMYHSIYFHYDNEPDTVISCDIETANPYNVIRFHSQHVNVGMFLSWEQLAKLYELLGATLEKRPDPEPPKELTKAEYDAIVCHDEPAVPGQVSVEPWQGVGIVEHKIEPEPYKPENIDPEDEPF